MRKFFFLLVHSLLANFLFCQGSKPYAVWEDQAAGIYRFVRLDATTGGKTNISTIPGMVAFVSGNTSAFNSINNQYYFEGLDGGGNYRLYSIDVASGVVLANPVLSNTLVGFEFNRNDSLLYGLRVASNSNFIVTIDPVTGLDTIVFPAGNFSGYVAGSFCLNSQLNYYSFISLTGSTYVLRTYDLQTGVQVTGVAFPDNVVGHRYSCFNNAVYGLWEVNNVYTLEIIDQLTGVHSTVDTLSGVMPGFVPESQSVNQSGQYTFRGFNVANNFALFTIDLSTAGVLANAATNDNAVGFEENSYCQLTADNSFIADDAPELNLFPVPCADKLHVNCSESLEWFEIVSPEGNSVLSVLDAGMTDVINMKDIPDGLYFFRGYSNGGIFCKRFILSRQK